MQVPKVHSPDVHHTNGAVPTTWNFHDQPQACRAGFGATCLRSGSTHQGKTPKDSQLSVTILHGRFSKAYLRWALSVSCLRSNCSFSYSATRRCLKYCTCHID